MSSVSSSEAAAGIVGARVGLAVKARLSSATPNLFGQLKTEIDAALPRSGERMLRTPELALFEWWLLREGGS